MQLAKVIVICFMLSISMQICCASAIPIWEFLSRKEKLSSLYSTFAQLVSAHCKTTAPSYQPSLPVNHCKRNLLTYGNEKLQSFTDAELDHLDPYQHAANELIWSAIMRDHPSATLVTTRKPNASTPGSSIIILTQSTAQQPTNGASLNPLFDNEHEHKYAMDMDTEYGYDHDKQSSSSSSTFLAGPFVFRVRPDGSPVEEDRERPLPVDDDLEQLFPSTSTSSSGTRNTRPNKHRKIATISALKQQHFAKLENPPFLSTQIRRRFLNNDNSDLNLAAMFADYYYGRRSV